MATKQTDGVSDVTAQSTGNDGGVMKANGTVGSGVVSSVGTPRADLGVFGSTVIDNDSADPALSAGVFGYNNERPIAKKTTLSLSTVSNNFLATGAGNPGGIRSIHKIESIRTRKLTTAIRENKWNEYSGKFDTGFPEVSEDVFYKIDTNGIVIGDEPIDKAANPTRQVPGQLTYVAGNENTILVPKNDEYKPRTN
jgi:hypothetical protein